MHALAPNTEVKKITISIYPAHYKIPTIPFIVPMNVKHTTFQKHSVTFSQKKKKKTFVHLHHLKVKTHTKFHSRIDLHIQLSSISQMHNICSEFLKALKVVSLYLSCFHIPFFSPQFGLQSVQSVFFFNGMMKIEKAVSIDKTKHILLRKGEYKFSFLFVKILFLNYIFIF